MAHTNQYTREEWNLRKHLQQDVEAWLRSVRDGNDWRDLPRENSPDFFAVGMRASVAVQAAIRRSIGAHYFASLEAYRDCRTAFPVLVYSFSPVFGGRPRTEYAYDIHHPKTPRSATHAIESVLAVALASIEKRLKDAGEIELAKCYAPHHAHHAILCVRMTNPKGLLAMLRGDEVIVSATIQLLAMAAALRDEAVHRDPSLNAAAAAYVGALHRRLRSFYLGVDLTAIAPELFAETISYARAAIAPSRAPSPATTPSGPIDLAA